MPSRGYLLCCLERTGSSLLAEALIGTGVAGRPFEYFNPVEQNQPGMPDIHGASNQVDNLVQVLIAGSTANGIFGAKVHWTHLRYLGMQITGEWNKAKRTKIYELLRSPSPGLIPLEAAASLLREHFSDLRPQGAAYALLRSHLPDLRFIWLKRKNMVARAISIYRARLTNVWSRRADEPGPAPAEQTPEFDLGEIHNLYCVGAFQDETWQQFFEQHEISPLPVFYEELVASHESTVGRVLEFLQIESAAAMVPKPTLAKQSDALSEEWERLYRKAVPDADT
jgi:trehalose 2-sulfotransferase